MVSYNDPYFPPWAKGRKYDLQMISTPLENLGQYDCVLIVTDHSDYDYHASCANRSWWSIPATPRRDRQSENRALLNPRACRKFALQARFGPFSRNDTWLPTAMQIFSGLVIRVSIPCFSQT